MTTGEDKVIPEGILICPMCDLPTEGEFLDMCLGAHEGWAEGNPTDHYFRLGEGAYAWGYKGLCHRSGVVSRDTILNPEPQGQGCVFCRAILKRERIARPQEKAI